MSLPAQLSDLKHTRTQWPTSDLAYLQKYRAVRAATEAICAPLADEDYVVQTMDDVSPPKWHLAHVTWFFETFLLLPFAKNYQPFNPLYDHLFNSYYETHSDPYPRPTRGCLSRPTVAETYTYRHCVDVAMERFLLSSVVSRPGVENNDILSRLILGLHHEQQHQELLLMDIKNILATNPLMPVYRSDVASPPPTEPPPLEWIGYDAGMQAIGHHQGAKSFAFDNEMPQHHQYIAPFQLGSRPVSNREFMAFIDEGGYERVELWLSDGWSAVRDGGWKAPLYWQRSNAGWHHRTLAGPQPVNPEAPVCHVSFYEADAYARWAGVRLPTESEWEVAAADVSFTGNFLESDKLQPAAPENPAQTPQQMFGDVWEWTGSAYRPYPGFKPLTGSLGEYNGKFMSGQMVLRGGCCITPESHIRATYRNFYPPHARWAFTGFRLARED
ncbi:ergothioneine biosynthesis protein EgtB [Marinobacter sp.]|uniref:ergothioneine biosynthesis protein EgtB n=1 Tax=Marinobacter sp. TaxID=50741 RepID=UPI0034A17CBD